MKNLKKIGTVIYALILASFGLIHLLDPNDMVNYVPSIFSAVATALVYVTGLALLAASVAIIIDKKVKLAALLTALLLLIIVLAVDLPNIFSHVETVRLTALPSLLKNLGMLAASLMVADS